jgi:hypothetical protein
MKPGHLSVSFLPSIYAWMIERTIGELHGLGTRSTELSRHDDLTTFRTRLHHESKHTIARTAHRTVNLTSYNQSIECTHRRTARPPSSLYRNDSHCATAESPRLCTFSAYKSSEFSGNLNRFCTSDVSSRMRRPFSPRTSCVRVARMII